MATLLYQGHGSFRLESADGKVLYLDPFAGEGYDKPADFILVTHEHGDHNQVQLVAKKPTTQIIRSKDVLKNGRYATLALGPFTVTATPACNKNHPIDRCVGFLVKVDGKALYFSGDTNKLESMRDLEKEHADWAFFCTDGEYNMSAEEASECAALVKAKRSVPVHTHVGMLFDDKVAERFHASGKTVVHPGETVAL